MTKTVCLPRHVNMTTNWEFNLIGNSALKSLASTSNVCWIVASFLPEATSMTLKRCDLNSPKDKWRRFHSFLTIRGHLCSKRTVRTGNDEGVFWYSATVQCPTIWSIENKLLKNQSLFVPIRWWRWTDGPFARVWIWHESSSFVHCTSTEIHVSESFARRAIEALVEHRKSTTREDC